MRTSSNDLISHLDKLIRTRVSRAGVATTPHPRVPPFDEQERDLHPFV
jgi:hypothetical protein